MRFADCILDLPTRQLLRHGEVVSLEPKVYELLETLIKRRPAVVTNDELDELLWPDVYVERTSLTRLVSKLRAALDDSPRSSRIVRTAYKTGYAFCAEVTSEQRPTVAPSKWRLFWGKQTLPLADGEYLAGRDDACALVIDAGTVSRRHARITVVSGTATIEDLESTNGTHVNGTRISAPTRLKAGDQLMLGSEQVQIRRQTASALTLKVEHNKSVGSKARKR